MKKMRKLIAIFALLAIAMTAVFADGNLVARIITVYGAETDYTDFEEALNAWSDQQTLKLFEDITVNSTIYVGSDNNDSASYTIDLNNHGIMFNGDSGSVLFVRGYKSLTINDSATSKTDRYITLNGYGRGVSVSPNGTESSSCIKVTGGYITGGNAVTGENNKGGGVYLGNNVYESTMNGGTIVGNRAAYGGGIYGDVGFLNIRNDSKIVHNTATLYGGGVYVRKAGVYIADSPQIIDNVISGVASNVCLNHENNDTAIHIGINSLSDSLSVNARIGVNVRSGHSKIITRDLCGNTDDARGTATNFISDDPSYNVILNSDGEVVLALPITANVDPSHAGVYYATYYDSAKSYVADANTEVYYASANANGKLTLVKVNDKIIKAGEGVILKSSSATITLIETTQSATYDSILTGSNTATTVTNALVLSCGENGVHFYKYTGSVVAHKAWLTE